MQEKANTIQTTRLNILRYDGVGDSVAITLCDGRNTDEHKSRCCPGHETSFRGGRDERRSARSNTTDLATETELYLLT